MPDNDVDIDYIAICGLEYLVSCICIFVYPRCPALPCLPINILFTTLPALFVFHSHNLLSVFTLAWPTSFFLSPSISISLIFCSLLVFLDVYYDGLIFNYWKQLPSCLSESPASYYPTLSSTSPSFSSLPSLPTSPSPSFPPRLLPLLLCWHRQQSNFN